MGAWDVVADVFGLGGPSGNDHGSSNWAAWGHPEIRTMLDNTVDPASIYEAAAAWRDQGQNTRHILTGFTRDLNGIVANGWRGGAADAALTALGPIEAWSASHADTADRIIRLMEDSGSAIAQAKAGVPPPKSHSWMETLAVSAVTGPVGGMADAVMQEQEQSDAHAEAVRIMTNVYSAPINDHRAAVPTYPQLADPTLPQPDQSPTGPAPGALYSAPGGPSGGAVGMGSAHITYPPAAVALQGVTSGSSSPGPQHGGAVTAEQAVRQPQHGNGEAATIAAAVAGTSVPMAATAAVRRARAAGSEPEFGTGQGAEAHLARGPALGEGRSGGAGRASTARHVAGIGPRPSSAAAEVAESRMGSLARGASAAIAERAGLGGMIPPMGAASGKRGEDSEHRRPSYLIEMDDIFADGRKVAPAVIGEDPAGHGGPS